MTERGRNLGIDYVEFTVRDLGAAKSFYSGAFGWKFQDWGDDYTSFDDGRLTGGFRSDPQAEPSARSILIVIYASNLSAARQRVIDAGGTIVGDLHHFPGGVRFYFTDPTGNLLAVWSEHE